jgi:putative NADH-flavin reductase
LPPAQQKFAVTALKLPSSGAHALNANRNLKIAVLGATGSVGRLLDRGHTVVCQSRSMEKLSHLVGGAQMLAFDPRDGVKLNEFVRGADVVIFALGADRAGSATLFSDSTSALVAAMKTEGVKRLIAITGVGAGETRGHGGFLYDRIIFPLFTHKVYEDKDRQEALITASDLDWIIVRPASYVKGHVTGPLEVHSTIQPDTVLRRITRDEVAEFIVEQVNSDRYVRQKPFIGHAR